MAATGSVAVKVKLADATLRAGHAHHINLRKLDETTVGIALDETTNAEER